MIEGRAMARGRLPDEGSVRLGPVALPAGRLVTRYGGTDRIAWVTVDPVPESARVWAELSELHPQTGLVPVQLDAADSGTPKDPRQADRLDAGAWLAAEWREWVSWPEGEDEAEGIERRSPFTLEWPGLAAAERAPLTAAERRHALEVVLPRVRQRRSETPSARIGLVAAGRPADVPLLLGWWPGNRGEEFLLPLTAVLRSWEDRFGARLVDVGDATLRLFAERPPRTLAAAQVLAAEQVVLADECLDGASASTGPGTSPTSRPASLNDPVWTGVLPDLAARLVNAPIWTFWWD